MQVFNQSINQHIFRWPK